jgi:hypothetical protein
MSLGEAGMRERPRKNTEEGSGRGKRRRELQTSSPGRVPQALYARQGRERLRHELQAARTNKRRGAAAAMGLASSAMRAGISAGRLGDEVELAGTSPRCAPRPRAPALLQLDDDGAGRVLGRQ